MTHHDQPRHGEARCRHCARVRDELDGVRTGEQFECGPCFTDRERNES